MKRCAAAAGARRLGPVGGIFVSYRREDARGQARSLSDALSTRYGADRVFRDVETIAPGVDFPEAIAAALDRSDVFLAVIGDKWLTAEKDGRRRLDDPDDYVRRELATALQRDIRVIPVLLETTTMPSRAELPAELGELADRNAIRLTDDTWEDGVNRLIRAIDASAAPPAPPPERPEPAAGQSRRGVAVFAGAVVAVVVVMVAAAVLIANRGDDSPGGGGLDPTVLTPPTLQRVEVDLELSPNAGRPGTRVTARGSGFEAQERVEIRFFTDIVARIRADAQGSFSDTFTVPDTPFRRPTEVFATGEQSLRTAEATFTVQ